MSSMLMAADFSRRRVSECYARVLAVSGFCIGRGFIRFWSGGAVAASTLRAVSYLPAAVCIVARILVLYWSLLSVEVSRCMLLVLRFPSAPSSGGKGLAMFFSLAGCRDLVSFSSSLVVIIIGVARSGRAVPRSALCLSSVGGFSRSLVVLVLLSVYMVMLVGLFYSIGG